MATLIDDADLGGFSIGRNYALETTPPQTMVWVASAVQDELAGFEFVQWPSDGWRLLTPEVRGGEAVWVDPSLAVWCRRSAHCATDPSDDRCAGAGRHESTHVCQKHEKCLKRA